MDRWGQSYHYHEELDLVDFQTREIKASTEAEDRGILWGVQNQVSMLCCI